MSVAFFRYKATFAAPGHSNNVSVNSLSPWNAEKWSNVGKSP